jgi:hypothetical protein
MDGQRTRPLEAVRNIVRGGELSNHPIFSRDTPRCPHGLNYFGRGAFQHAALQTYGWEGSRDFKLQSSPPECLVYGMDIASEGRGLKYATYAVSPSTSEMTWYDVNDKS